MTIWKKEIPTDITSEQLGGAAKSLGIELVEVADNHMVCKMPVDKRTIQPMGILNGGASCLLAETIGSMAANGTLAIGEYAVGLTLNANHIRSVRQGSVFATATPKHLGKSTQIWDIDIRNESQQQVCSVTLTLAILKSS